MSISSNYRLERKKEKKKKKKPRRSKAVGKLPEAPIIQVAFQSQFSKKRSDAMNYTKMKLN